MNTETTAQSGSPAESKGIELQLSTIGFQVLNFLVLMLVLNWLIFKPLLKMLKEREQKIREGVANAEKADLMIKESEEVRVDVLRKTKAESQTILENAKKSAEEVKTEIVEGAKTEAEKIISAGSVTAEAEKARVAKELQTKMAELVVMAAEKIVKEKIDQQKDAKLIEESLKSITI